MYSSLRATDIAGLMRYLTPSLGSSGTFKSSKILTASPDCVFNISVVGLVALRKRETVDDQK